MTIKKSGKSKKTSRLAPKKMSFYCREDYWLFRVDCACCVARTLFCFRPRM